MWFETELIYGIVNLFLNRKNMFKLLPALVSAIRLKLQVNKP